MKTTFQIDRRVFNFFLFFLFLFVFFTFSPQSVKTASAACVRNPAEPIQAWTCPPAVKIFPVNCASFPDPASCNGASGCALSGMGQVINDDCIWQGGPATPTPTPTIALPPCNAPNYCALSFPNPPFTSCSQQGGTPIAGTNCSSLFGPAYTCCQPPAPTPTPPSCGSVCNPKLPLSCSKATGGCTTCVPVGASGRCQTPPTIPPTVPPPPTWTPSPTLALGNNPPWYQGIGLDIRIEKKNPSNGFSYDNPIPSTATCGPYAIIPANGSSTPGVVYSGNYDANFGSGNASALNWQVGGSSPVAQAASTASLSNTGSTSYNAILSRVQAAGLSATPITSIANGGCTSYANCTLIPTLSGANSLVAGVYLLDAGTPPSACAPGAAYDGTIGDCVITLQTPSSSQGPLPGIYFNTGKGYIFLVHGSLRIQTQIHTISPSTDFFTASGNIIVDRTIGG